MSGMDYWGKGGVNMGMTDSEACLSMEKVLRQYVLPLLILSLLGFFIYRAGSCVNFCKEVLLYTVPAFPADAAKELSTAAYWQEMGLIEHVKVMPSTAQRYFVLYGIAGCVYGILAVITAAGGCSMVFRRNICRFCK